MRTFGIDVVRKILGVHTRISGVFLLVQTLNQVERHLGRIAELLVAVYLQRGEVVELRRGFRALFLLHVDHGKRFTLNGLEGSLAILFLVKAAFGGGKRGVAIDGGQHPIRLRLEVVYFFLSAHDECQGGCLHPPDAQHLSVASVFQGVQARGVHAQYPVADGA